MSPLLAHACGDTSPSYPFSSKTACGGSSLNETIPTDGGKGRTGLGEGLVVLFGMDSD
jgi:hypothetical protein